MQATSFSDEAELATRRGRGVTLDSRDELVFVALGGLGEIGMNAALYGFGPRARRKWLMVDLGVGFAGPELPGIDLVMPSLEFIEKLKRDLVALVVTHAHEDHIGAVLDLWPRLGCDVYATRFAAGLLAAKQAADPRGLRIPVHTVPLGARLDLAPFDVEYVSVAHSIPESCALVIRTALGAVVHTGDWKIDATPMVGLPTDVARLRAVGDAGVLAMICDSTNMLREGVSPSEQDVAQTLRALIVDAPGRVAVTTFASNVARIRAVAEAASAAGRQVVVVGRAMQRIIAVAGECGYLDGMPDFRSVDAFDQLPRDKVVALVTGSQGEARAALSRIAEDEHPAVTFAPGDRVIFSSRTIPGNEKAVGTIINGLVAQGIEVVTDRTHLVHVSGHPRRAEVTEMYAWVRPRIAIPAHGEAVHLAEHARLARSLGVRHVVKAGNGDIVQLAPGDPAVIDEAPHGRVQKDGEVILPPGDEAVQQRRKLSFSGVVSVAIAVTARGEVAGDPDVVLAGVPGRGSNGKTMDDIIDAAIFETLDSLPRQKRRDADATATAVEKAVRNAVSNAWGKKPTVHVLVVEV
jgi:ribonuclease J